MIPEQLILLGIQKSWRFMQERLLHHIGYFASEYSTVKQEEIKTLLENDEAAIYLGPSPPPRLPAFVLAPGNEGEEQAFIGDVGMSNRILPYPNPANPTAYNPPEFLGVTYGDTEQPEFLGSDGLQGSKGPRVVPTRRKNLRYTREASSIGDEQYDRAGQIRKLWHEDQQRLSTTAQMDRGNMEIVVLCATSEQANIYARMLRWVLRKFRTWFQVNGLIGPRFELGQLTTCDFLRPSTSIIPFQRTVPVTYSVIDISVEVETVLYDWMIEMQMVTSRADGTLDYTPIITVSGEDS